jgi:hypothetical protein
MLVTGSEKQLNLPTNSGVQNTSISQLLRLIPHPVQLSPSNVSIQAQLACFQLRQRSAISHSSLSVHKRQIEPTL